MSWYGARKTKKQIMEGVPHASAKKVANNTVEYVREDGTRVIRHHLTDIVEILPNGVVRLNSGGYKSHTTKERLNCYLPDGFTIWANRGVWYLGLRGHWDEERSEYVKPEKGPWPFKDGMIIKPDGTVGGTSEHEERRIKLLNKKIAAYCRAVREMASLPLPETGDCFYCAMYEVNSNKPLGEVTKDRSHLLSHLDDKYIHGSLLLNAMRWASMSDFAIALVFRNSSGMRDRAVNAVRRYFRAQLGLAY